MSIFGSYWTSCSSNSWGSDSYKNEFTSHSVDFVNDDGSNQFIYKRNHNKKATEGSGDDKKTVADFKTTLELVGTFRIEGDKVFISDLEAREDTTSNSPEDESSRPDLLKEYSLIPGPMKNELRVYELMHLKFGWPSFSKIERAFEELSFEEKGSVQAKAGVSAAKQLSQTLKKDSFGKFIPGQYNDHLSSNNSIKGDERGAFQHIYYSTNFEFDDLAEFGTRFKYSHRGDSKVCWDDKEDGNKRKEENAVEWENNISGTWKINEENNKLILTVTEGPSDDISPDFTKFPSFQTEYDLLPLPNGAGLVVADLWYQFSFDAHSEEKINNQVDALRHEKKREEREKREAEERRKLEEQRIEKEKKEAADKERMEKMMKWVPYLVAGVAAAAFLVLK